MTQPTSGGVRKLVHIGNYKFTGRRLGKGNFARVEEATHTILNNKVAIKIMDINTIKEEYVVRNLYREAKIMSRLSHPCIAALFQTMQHGNLYYLVTELIGGGDLCNFIKGQRNGKLEERYTRVYARQLISAISHMHNLGIIHRDLKMENVMLTSGQEMIKIVDFGLSNVFTTENPLHTHCGSPEYAAPELFIEGKHYGPEVDLWSLGVILYGMVVGQLPFVSSRETGATSHQARRKKLLEQINKGLSTPHRKALALLSSEFKAMMAKLLIADANKRIKITELIFHPWITEKGRKSIRSNPLKKLDEYTQTSIIKEVAKLIHVDWTEIQRLIKSEPHGNSAGMYNILAYGWHERTDANIPHYVTPRPRTAITNDITRPKSPAKRATQLKSAQPQKVSKTVQANATPRRVDQSIANRKLMIDKSMGEDTTNINRTKMIRSSEKERRELSEKGINFAPLRPKPKQTLIVQRPTSPLPTILVAPKRTIKSPIGLRSKYVTEQYRRSRSSLSQESDTSGPSNTIIQTPAHANIKLKYRPKGDFPGYTKMHEIGESPFFHDRREAYNHLLYTMTSPSQNTRSRLSADANKRELRTPFNIGRKVASRTQSATVQQQQQHQTIIKQQQQRCMTQANNRRPLTTGPTHTAERAAIKRRSMLPVMTSKRTGSKQASARPGTVNPYSAQQRAKESRQSNSRATPRDCSHRKYEKDDPRKYLSSPVRSNQQHQNAEFSNDPIARSIAGYVSKNISSKMQTLKWIKGTKMNFGT